MRPPCVLPVPGCRSPYLSSPQDLVAVACLVLSRPWFLSRHPSPWTWGHHSADPGTKQAMTTGIFMCRCLGGVGTCQEEGGRATVSQAKPSHLWTVLLFLPPAASRFQPLLSTPPQPSWSIPSWNSRMDHSPLSGLLLPPLSSFVGARGREEHLFSCLFPSSDKTSK